MPKGRRYRYVDKRAIEDQRQGRAAAQLLDAFSGVAAVQRDAQRYGQRFGRVYAKLQLAF